MQPCTIMKRSLSGTGVIKVDEPRSRLLLDQAWEAKILVHEDINDIPPEGIFFPSLIQYCQPE